MAEQAGRKSFHNGKSLYFFSDDSKAEFDKNPVKDADKSEGEKASENSPASSSTSPKEFKSK